MSVTVLVCEGIFDGTSDELTRPTEILVEGNRITSMGRSVKRPQGAQLIDLSDRTVSPGFIDTHEHLTMDAAHLVQQTLDSSASNYKNIHHQGGTMAQIKWHDNLDSGLDFAQREHKHVLLDFHNPL